MATGCRPTLTMLRAFVVLLHLYIGEGLTKIPSKKTPEKHNASILLDELLQNYDPRLRPDFGGEPTLVDVNMNVRSMGPISEVDMAYQMDCYFRQGWVDRRLQFQGPIKILHVSVKILERLWKPDTHFFNGKRSYLHTVTTPNKLLRINQEGRILYSMRLTIKASCPMHLQNFPMDTQHCPLLVGSHGYGRTDVLYSWTHGADQSIKMASDMLLSQFDLVGFPHTNNTLVRHRDTYSILSATFTLHRHMGYFLINVYVPCSLLVVISWVGFWINREATADRIALGITTVLTMAFLAIENRNDQPKVSYSTALDYFVGMCFGFVIASILQFAGVHFFTKHRSGEEMFPESDDEDYSAGEVKSSVFGRRSSRHYTYNHPEKANGQNNSLLGHEAPPRAEESCCSKFFHCISGSTKYRELKARLTPEGWNSVSNIDRLSRVMFPAVFMTFHIFYWVSYLNKEDHFDLRL